MSKVRMKYDGWVALPAGMRKKLGLANGQQLELELVGGTIVLRAAGAADAVAAEPDEEIAEPVAAVEPVLAELPVKRGRGRPRKNPGVVITKPAKRVGSEPIKPRSPSLPPSLKARGRRAVGGH